MKPTFKQECADPYLNYIDNKKLAKMSSAKRKNEYLWSRFLLNYILKQKFSFSNDEGLKVSENGKPYIFDCPFRFSISHSKDYLALAVSTGSSVGIDIESYNKKSSYLKIAEEHFSKPEHDSIKSQLTSDSKTVFLQLWSLKEAAFKLYDLKATKKNTQFYFDVKNKTIQSVPAPFEIHKLKMCNFIFAGNQVSLANFDDFSQLQILQLKLIQPLNSRYILEFNEIEPDLNFFAG